MQDELIIEDGSGDHKYYTMIPNIVLNHSSANDQALYSQMKRFAGEKSGGGYCSASKRTLMKKMKIGRVALNESITYLIDHKWIKKIGTRKVMTDSGAQDVDVYRVNDIWKMNADFYQGASGIAPLPVGAPEKKRGAVENAKGAVETAPTKNYIKQESITLSVEEESPIKRKSYSEMKGYATNRVKPIRARGEEIIGHKFPNQLAQEKNIVKCLVAGYSEEQILACFEALLDDKYWGEQGVDFGTVASQIGKGKRKQKANSEITNKYAKYA